MKRKKRVSHKEGFRFCNGCDLELPATLEIFGRDSSRKGGIAYECRKCQSERNKGRDRRRERWVHMTPEQKERKKALARKYGKTLRGRAIYLRKAYQRIDSCDLSVDEVMDIIEKPCVHCGTTDLNRGLDRIDNNLPHTRDNVSPSCAPCNFARGDRFSFEEMQKIGAVIRQVFKDRSSD